MIVPKGLFSVTIPTIEEEATSVWRTINDIQFLEKMGYQIHLPDHPKVKVLLDKSRKGNFGNDDYLTIVNLLSDGIYSPAAYQAAKQKVDKRLKLLNRIAKQVSKQRSEWDWDFKMYAGYTVTFTRYGSGGSYNPEQGSITLFTTTKGDFKRYSDPANTIIHEFIHLGIETSLVQTFNLSHVMKEQVVDQIVTLLFGKQLPEYEVQDMGTTPLSGHLNRTKDINHLRDTLIRCTR